MTWTYSVSSTHHSELLSTGHFCVLVPSTNPVMDLSIISNIEFFGTVSFRKKYLFELFDLGNGTRVH